MNAKIAPPTITYYVSEEEVPRLKRGYHIAACFSKYVNVFALINKATIASSCDVENNTVPLEKIDDWNSLKKDYGLYKIKKENVMRNQC